MSHYYKITTVIESEFEDIDDLRAHLDISINTGDGIYLEVDDAEIEELNDDYSLKD